MTGPLPRGQGGASDPLMPAVLRFVGARTFTGARALMRRFGIGLQRARWLLVTLEDLGMVRGHFNSLIATVDGFYSFRIYRVFPQTWAKALAMAAVLVPAAEVCGYWRGTWHCRGDGFLWDADHDGWDPAEQDHPCPECNVLAYLVQAKDEAQTTVDWHAQGQYMTGEAIWLAAVAYATHCNAAAVPAALIQVGPVAALVPDESHPEGCSVRWHNGQSPVTVTQDVAGPRVEYLILDWSPAETGLAMVNLLARRGEV